MLISWRMQKEGLSSDLGMLSTWGCCSVGKDIIILYFSRHSFFFSYFIACKKLCLIKGLSSVLDDFKSLSSHNPWARTYFHLVMTENLSTPSPWSRTYLHSVPGREPIFNLPLVDNLFSLNSKLRIYFTWSLAEYLFTSDPCLRTYLHLVLGRGLIFTKCLAENLPLPGPWWSTYLYSISGQKSIFTQPLAEGLSSLVPNWGFIFMGRSFSLPTIYI